MRRPSSLLSAPVESMLSLAPQNGSLLNGLDRRTSTDGNKICFGGNILEQVSAHRQASNQLIEKANMGNKGQLGGKIGIRHITYKAL